LETFDDYVIHVCQNVSSKLGMKDYCYHSVHLAFFSPSGIPTKQDVPKG
jgi:hypothetical protein